MRYYKGNDHRVALVRDRLFVDGKEVRAAVVVLPERSQNRQTPPRRGRQQRYSSPKLNFPDVQSRVQTVDVFFMRRNTHCDELDIVNIDSYDCYLNSRKQKTVKSSGDIATFMNNNVLNHFSEIPTDCEYVQWFKVSQTEEDLVLGTIYIPQENN